MAIPLEAVGALVVVILASVGEAYRRGVWLFGAIKDKRRITTEAHKSIPEVVDTLDEVHETVEEMNDNVTDVKDTIAYLHADDLRHDALARDRLDVESDDDFLRGARSQRGDEDTEGR